ncbi:MAG: hypothetical protein KAG95_04190, partial [Bacteroidales bacterium]|nr:hypothetical protein [Bacteroidales bacterium]
MKFNYLIFLFLFIGANVFAQKYTPVAPKNNFVFVDSIVEFKMNNHNSEQLRLLISSDTNFSNIIIDTLINLNSINIPLSRDNKYYWKITSNNYSSNIYNFKIINPYNSQLNLSWYMADSNENISNSVSKLTDLLGHNNFIQNDDNYKATVDYSSLLQKNYICFNGSNDYLSNENSVLPKSFITFIKIDELPSYSSYYNFGGENGLSLRPTNFDARFNNNSSKRVYFGQSDTSYFIVGISTSTNEKPAKGFIQNNIFELGADRTFDEGVYNIGSRSGSYAFNGKLFEQFVFYDNYSDSLLLLYSDYLRHKYSPPINLGYDININCSFTDTVINAGERFAEYSWSTGISGQVSTTVNQSGTYSVTVTDIFGYESSDSLIVTYPKINTINDTVICFGDTLLWDTNLSNDYTFLWNTGSTDSLFKISSAGEYFVKVTDSLGNFRLSDAVTISIDSFPAVASLGNDTTLCQGATIGLISGSEQAETYLWNDGSTDSLLIILSEGSYSLTVTNTLGCVAVDSINITLHGLSPTVDFSADTVCFGDSTTFIDLSSIESPYEIIAWNWDFGDGTSDTLQNPKHLYTYADTFLVHLTAVTDSGCAGNIYKQIIVKDTPVAFFHT